MLHRFEVKSSARVLVVGDVMLDRYVLGSTTRISPEAPVPVVRVESTEDRPGGAANVAMNIRALGLRPQLAGATGDDDAADVLHRHLRDAGIECRIARRSGHSTITKLRVVSQHQQLLRLDYESDPAPGSGDDVRRMFEQSLTGADAIVVSDYAKGGLERVGEIIAAAAAAAIPVLVDPKSGDFGRYRGATVLTPNLREFEAAAGVCRGPGELVRKARELCAALSLQAFVVTQGERGMTLVPRQGEALHLSAHAREVFDVTGAGDTVIATLAAALVSGYQLEAAVHFANAAAGVVVGKLGAATVTLAELNAALTDHPPVEKGILSGAQAAAAVQLSRGRGERIVMTNGCFDILHAGHVQYLAQARLLGDRLVVAVNDDASVARLKGTGRPINKLASRCSVLAALSAVDWVVPFSEDTPEKLIAELAPDVLVKGGDYEADAIAGADFVKSKGGEVRVLPLLEGSSTSAVIASVLANGRKAR